MITERLRQDFYTNQGDHRKLDVHDLKYSPNSYKYTDYSNNGYSSRPDISSSNTLIKNHPITSSQY